MIVTLSNDHANLSDQKIKHKFLSLRIIQYFQKIKMESSLYWNALISIMFV